MTRRRDQPDAPDPDGEKFDASVEALAHVRAAELQAGVCLTPEWRAFFVALGAPVEPDPATTE